MVAYAQSARTTQQPRPSTRRQRQPTARYPSSLIRIWRAARPRDEIRTGHHSPPITTSHPRLNGYIDCLDLSEGDLVLEPSCGDGALIGAILANEPKAVVHAYEIRDSAASKAYEKFPQAIVCTKDFLTKAPKPQFNFVVMNPPFSRQQDIDHILHAHKFLKPHGKLVSIAGAGVNFRTNRKTMDFRQFVEDHGGSIEALPEGAFKSSGTAVRTVLVEIPA